MEVVCVTFSSSDPLLWPVYISLHWPFDGSEFVTEPQGLTFEACCSLRKKNDVSAAHLSEKIYINKIQIIKLVCVKCVWEFAELTADWQQCNRLAAYSRCGLIYVSHCTVCIKLKMISWQPTPSEVQIYFCWLDLFGIFLMLLAHMGGDPFSVHTQLQV